MRLMTSIAKVLGLLSLMTWMSFMYLTLQYDATRPTVRQPNEGRVYDLNNHGHVVYLNAEEQDNLHYLAGGALGFFVMSALIAYYLAHPKRLVEIHNDVLTVFYTFLTAAGLYAFGSAIRREGASVAQSFGDAFDGRGKIALRSDNTIDDCRTRLEKAVYFNAMNISGDVGGDRIHLYFVRKDLRNSFAPHFYGKFHVRPSGTMIKGRFTMHCFVKLLMGVWFTGIGAVIILVTPLSIRSLLTGRPVAQNPTVGLFFPPLLFICGLFMVHWGNQIGKDDKVHILHFLQQTLNARQEIYF